MVNNSETKVIYKGDGKTKVFPYTFAAIDADTIKVAVYDETSGVESTLTNDYYVDTTAKTVTYPGYAPGQAPAESQQPGVLQKTQKLVIYRETPLDQQQDLGEKYPLPIVESIGDKLTLIVQELKETLGRTITIDISSNETGEQLKERIFAAEETASAMANNASTSAESAAISEKAASTSKIKAKASETNAKAWATSTESPDGAADSDSATGKTQSAKTWAKTAQDAAVQATSTLKNAAATVKAAVTGSSRIYMWNGDKGYPLTSVKDVATNKVYDATYCRLSTTKPTEATDIWLKPVN